MSTAIGYGMMRREQLLFDEKTGKPLNNNLLTKQAVHLYGSLPHLEAQFV